MPTQHRPEKEVHTEKAAVPILTQFYKAISLGNEPKARKLLVDIEKHPPHGLWMHRALSLALEHYDIEQRKALVDLLFNSKHPPTPTATSDFIRFTVGRPNDGMLYRLLDAGFDPHPKTVKHLLERIERAKDIDTSRLLPRHISVAGKHNLVRACAVAILDNASEKWMQTLNAALPQPLPAMDITDCLMGLMNWRGANAHIDPKALDRARDLWWVDHNMAQLVYDKLASQRYNNGLPKYSDEQLAGYGRALATIATSEISEQTPDNAAVGPPRKRL